MVNEEDASFLLNQVLRIPIGDANLDGQFDSTDLVQTFVAGEYEDDNVGNSGWASGDWNCDQEFDTSDLLAALQDGGYEQGPRSGVIAVPEPSTFGLVCFAAISLLLGRPGAAAPSRTA